MRPSSTIFGAGGCESGTSRAAQSGWKSDSWYNRECCWGRAHGAVILWPRPRPRSRRESPVGKIQILQLSRSFEAGAGGVRLRGSGLAPRSRRRLCEGPDAWIQMGLRASQQGTGGGQGEKGNAEAEAQSHGRFVFRDGILRRSFSKMDTVPYLPVAGITGDRPPRTPARILHAVLMQAAATQLLRIQ